MPTYYTNNSVSIRDDSGNYIPIDTSNSDYQAYLAWVAEGNTIVTTTPPSGGDSTQLAGNIWTDVSAVFGGTSGGILYNNAGVLGELSSSLTIPPMLADGRLTLVSNTPVVQPNASSATTLYYTPYLGNRVTLYNGTVWQIMTFAELSIAVPSTSNTNYDVFIYDNSGTLTLDLTAWTNDTTRATALTTQDGVLVKTGATPRRYIGTVRTNPTSGQMSDEPAMRHVWNMYNRVAAQFYAGTTGSYNYTTATWRSAGNITTLGLSRVQWVCGQNTHVALTNYQVIYNATATVYAAGGIGFDRTDGNDAQILGTGITSGDWPSPSTAFYDSIVTPGYHYGQRVEFSQASGTTTWYQSTTAVASGMRGVIFC